MPIDLPSSSSYWDFHAMQPCKREKKKQQKEWTMLVYFMCTEWVYSGHEIKEEKDRTPPMKPSKNQMPCAKTSKCETER